MSVMVTTSSDGKTLTLGIGNRFDFSIQKEFRVAYEDAGNSISTYVVDLKNTEFMDSTACGMLLVLKDYVGGDGMKIKIKNSSEEVKKTMEMIQFHKLFDMS